MAKSNSSLDTNKQYYIEEYEAPDLLTELQNTSLMQKKGRNPWHCIAITGILTEHNMSDLFIKYDLALHELDQPDRYGYVPLHYAYAYTTNHVLQHRFTELLFVGAKPDILTPKGKKPMDYLAPLQVSSDEKGQAPMPHTFVAHLVTLLNNQKKTTNPKDPIAEEQFIAAVKQFKAEHGIKSLRDQVFSPMGKELYQFFITNPTIFSWLTRPATAVQFREDGVAIVNKYEFEFYHGTALYSLKLCGARFNIDARASGLEKKIEHYYKSGFCCSHSVGFTLHRQLLAITEQNVEVKFPEDIYRAGSDALNKPDPSRANGYTIYWTAKDGFAIAHQITLVARHDNTGATTAVFMLNSLHNTSYNNKLALCFKHNAYRNTEGPHTWIDVSHNIQVSENDGNCVIYSLNFCKATKAFLTDPAYRAKMDAYCDAAQFQEAGTFLSNGIKALMPQYYTKSEDGTMVTVSAEALKQYHLKFRWELGNDSIRGLHAAAMS